MLNVFFSGNLGQDCEANEVDGVHVVNFSVAVKTDFGKDAEPTWVRCALWGERGKKLEEYLTAGKGVSIAGTMTFREYESTKHKKTMTSYDVRVNELDFTSGGSKSDEKEDKPAKNGRSSSGRDARR